jgi:8-oxo-dGTP pyrophosphatase MutT (NUDIX family)
MPKQKELSGLVDRFNQKSAASGTFFGLTCYEDTEMLWKPHTLPERRSLPQHFTASGLVLHQEHVLLVHHKRIGAWLPPGGHIEDRELPHEAAVREIYEETGVQVEVLSASLVDTGNADAFLLPSPLCMHAIQAREKGQELYHLDIAYLCRPILDVHLQSDKTLPELTIAEEVHDVAWVALNHLHTLPLAKNVLEVLDLAHALETSRA